MYVYMYMLCYDYRLIYNDAAGDNDVNDAGADINDADTEVIVPRKEICGGFQRSVCICFLKYTLKFISF